MSQSNGPNLIGIETLVKTGIMGLLVYNIGVI